MEQAHIPSKIKGDKTLSDRVIDNAPDEAAQLAILAAKINTVPSSILEKSGFTTLKLAGGAPIVKGAFAVKDGIDGYSKAGEVFYTENPTTAQKLGSAYAQTLNGLTFGVTPIREVAEPMADMFARPVSETVSNIVPSFSNGVVNGFKYIGNGLGKLINN